MKTLSFSFLGVLLAALLVWTFLPLDWKLQIQEEAAVGAYLKNLQGIRALHDQDAAAAATAFSEAMVDRPREEKLFFNLGVALQMAKKSEDAVKAYQLLLKSPDRTTEEAFLTEYNLGTLYQSAEDVEKALQHYQAALDLNPTSKETKINIELLIQQNGGKGKGQGNQKKDPQDGDGQGQNQDQKGQGDQPDKPKEYAKNPQPQKPQFKSQELSPSDVNKILGEIKQQEQRIRADFNRKDVKEQKRDKDW